MTLFKVNNGRRWCLLFGHFLYFLLLSHTHIHACTHTLTFSLPLSLSLSLSHTHTHTHTRTLSLSLSLKHTHFIREKVKVTREPFCPHAFMTSRCDQKCFGERDCVCVCMCCVCVCVCVWKRSCHVSRWKKLVNCQSFIG